MNEDTKSLIRYWPYNDYRHYPLLKEEQKKEAMCLRISSMLKEGAQVFMETYKGQRGVIILRQLPWDSSFFKMPMGAIEGLFLEERADLTLRYILLEKAFKWVKERGIKHLSFKVDTADIKTVLALQKKGFYLVDTLVTFLYLKKYTQLKKIKNLFKLRAFEKGDYKAVMDIVAYAFKGFSNRFTNDPYLPKEGMLALYRGWVENLIKRDDGYLIVAERGDRVVGFLGYFRLHELCEVTGRLHVGRALSAVGPNGKGCYPQFIAHLGDAPFYPDTVEGTASINHLEVQKTWVAIGLYGSAPLVRVQHVFHYYSA